ncbi:trehalose operon repressor [Paenibacillus gallinarum]|uniref:Trehalose operon repressor n=1 Tax=Paenibacillus gallinarum TaxID=2762232 RepID=A0ABR8SXT4_9BACL|nr:trehalose operon repressor [Paenibacillus gallinarum]MBD7968317.1 trehalose operon repressor [Paenibacillus gallinarum]
MMNNIFVTLYKDFAEKIDSGILAPGSKLPSEHELAQHYEITRETVRKGLNLLAQNGYIHKVKGKGSFVLERDRYNFPVSGLVSYKEMSERMGKLSNTLVYVTECTEAGEFISKQLQVSADTKVWRVVRAREIDGERIILDIDFLLASIVPHLSKDITGQSIYEYLEKELNLKISYAKKVISVEHATSMDHEYMDIGEDTHVVVVRGYVHLEDTTLFQYSESRHRLDKFQFVDFARRENTLSLF